MIDLQTSSFNRRFCGNVSIYYSSQGTFIGDTDEFGSIEVWDVAARDFVILANDEWVVENLWRDAEFGMHQFYIEGLVLPQMERCFEPNGRCVPFRKTVVVHIDFSERR